MVKVNKKVSAAVVLQMIFMCIFMCAVCACGTRDEWIVIGDEAGEFADAEDSAGTEPEESADKLQNDGADNGTSTTEEAMIQVYVCGAVISPGVVSIPAGSRAEAALAAAGGFAENAAEDCVNLAAWVRDGEMLYFPGVNEQGEVVERREVTGENRVNINTADERLLCTLPGIGEAKAAAIRAYREENGSFVSCEDIMKVPGIKEAAYEKIRDMITVE